MGICVRCGNQRDPASQSCPHCGAGSAQQAPQVPPAYPPPTTAPFLEAPGPPTSSPESWPAPVSSAQVPGPAPRRSIGAKFRQLFTRPPGYRSVFVWLVTGMLRNPRGLIGALLASWFNLPIAVLLGGVGMVVGGIGGYVGGAFTGSGQADSWAHDIPLLDGLLSSALLQGGGIIGMLLGIAAGAIGGFVLGLALPWFFLAASSPIEGIGRFLAQLVVAALCGVLYTFYAIAVERWRINIFEGGREPSRRERALLEPIIEDCARRMGLASTPKLMISDDRMPNAMAYSRHIVLYRGFLDAFEYETEPIAAVLCHELTHWRNADCVSNYFIRGVALPLYIAYTVCSFLLRITRGTIFFVLWMAFWPIMVSIRYFVNPLRAAGGRDAEYRADQGAVVAGHRDGIRTVLMRFRETFDGARNGWDMSILATHPAPESRLERVEEPGVEYPLPDPENPDMPTPVIITGSLARD
ncbi:M48 family metalloprotease [Kribbella sp. NBC_01505]|uniref:M48 family metalloprotease n=1 Tax=Kribbella sp. NBC_01505 TaxID=2903580 RepID=UPI003865199A